jgi:ATP-dependent DNA helicase RecG
MDSERFGLSQLHQLRGRVGRGDDQSYCFLLSDKLGKTAKERIESLVNSSSGFEIAEKDLELRGPGEIFGLRQHGLPELKLANLVSDKKTLIEIQKYVKMIISEYQLKNIDVVKYVRSLAETMENWFTL